MSTLQVMLTSLGLMLGWVTLFRLPFRSPARRRQIGIWLSERSRLRADAAFAVFGTITYLGLGILVLLILSWCTRVPWASYSGVHSIVDVPLTLLAIVGASSLNALCMSVLYRIDSTADVPGEVARIQWISSILALPREARWVLPAIAALVEEFVFRGAVFLGLGASGASLAQATIFSTLLFTVGQVLLVSTRTQAVVMAVSSCTLGLIACPLVAATGSIIPALVVHMSFAGFYTNMSAKGAEISNARRRWSL